MAVEIGKAVPRVVLQTTAGTVVLPELKGKAVIAFYAEDSTPTCSAQLTALKADHDLLVELGARLFAISADSPESHATFAAGLGGLPFELVSDVELAIAKGFGVVDESGRRSRRAVFVIDDGVVVQALPWFNPANSAQYQQIFEALGLGM